MIKKLFYTCNILVLAALIASCLACYIDPSVFWPLQFLGLAFPFIVLFAILFLLISAGARTLIFWVNLAAIMLSWPFIKTIVSLHSDQEETPKAIKVMSYNVRNFDLYNWSGNKATRSDIMQLIRAEAPDIICFQEYYTDDNEFKDTEYLRDSLGYAHHYMRITFDKDTKTENARRSNHMQWGLAIFSRYDIVDKGLVQLGQSNANQCMYADLRIDGHLLRVYNTHLQSIHLGYDDYDTIEELSENQSTSWRKLKNILRKMKRATAARAHQARTLQEAIARYQGPRVLCGDFNDAPVSYTYHTISRGMQDAFVARGMGFGSSFATRLGVYRIDFMLTDPAIAIHSCRTIHRRLSDHYPIVATLTLPAQP